mmetsp:Transcript_36380/g.92975  ORF Transcript_36380/g.92975 Transcript_36380/m.92975 type:complete len:89 (-) Transcript_36380:595-861(-)|eukprot:jgi/Tetstr1/455389/TSEL_042221.t1
MDLSQQVKNSTATIRFASNKQKPYQGQSKPANEHEGALQALANGDNPPYSATLRIVEHEGSKAPFAVKQATRKPTGYCRNENGGHFTS